MSKPTIEEILAPKSEARPRLYAYSIDDKAHKGFRKVGQTNLRKWRWFEDVAHDHRNIKNS